MVDNYKIKNEKLDKRGKIKLPSAMIEECNMTDGAGLEIIYGKTYNCAIIIPAGSVIGKRNQERIGILVNEKLDRE